MGRAIAWLNYLGVATVMVTMVATLTDVLGRYLFNKPLLGATEVGEMSMVAVVFFGAAYTQRIRGHVSVDAVYQRLSYRGRAAVDLFNSVWMAALAALFVWKGVESTVGVWEAGEISVALHIPLFIIKAWIPLGMLLLVMQTASDMFVSSKKIMMKRTPDRGIVPGTAKSGDQPGQS